MCDRIDLIRKIKELEKENNVLKEELKCAETNFLTCNADLAALGELVGGSCYDETYDLVKKLVNKEQDKIIEGLLCFIENNVAEACPYEIDDEQLEISWIKCQDCGTLHGQQRDCWLRYFKNYGNGDSNA